MKDKIILKDGTTIEIESGASLGAIPVMSATKTDMIMAWDAFTNDNLKEVTIKNGDDVVVATYQNITLVNETSAVNPDGTILTHFKFREKTDVELRLDALEETQADQDAAIEDLGALTSELAAEEA